MSLVFDTSVLVNLERREPKSVGIVEKLQQKAGFKPYTTFFNHFEFILGNKRKFVKNREKAENFLNRFEILHTTEETSKIMSDLKYNYDKKGITISIPDLIVASLAIENNMTLVTSDKDFQNIKELKLELIA
jgi:predicted nucleic acid-binding protein